MRALVVQLASAVETVEGPDAIEATVTAVGSAVGGRIETEYRRAREIVGRLSPKQIADLYVRLKAAIDGDFYVIELSDERIAVGDPECRIVVALGHRSGGPAAHQYGKEGEHARKRPADTAD